MDYETFRKLSERSEGHQGINMNIPDELKSKARTLCWKLNALNPDDRESAMEICRSLFGKCSEMLYLMPPFHCDYGFNISFDGVAVINYNCTILDTSSVRIGHGVFIGPNVCISCATHAIDPEQRARGVAMSKPVVLEEGVWIGANSVICPGVTIGKGSVIGAGSVVNKSIPAGVVAAGSPCRVLRSVTEEDRIPLEELDY